MGIRRTRRCEQCGLDKPKDGFQFVDLGTRRQWQCTDCQQLLTKTVAVGDKGLTAVQVVGESEDKQ